MHASYLSGTTVDSDTGVIIHTSVSVLLATSTYRIVRAYCLSSMWGPLCLVWMFLWATLGAPLTSTVCPEKCECSVKKDGLKAHCLSLDFLSKLRSKQIQDIVELDISHLSLKFVDHKLKKLKNLRKLHLSNNMIGNLNKFPQLPHLTHLYLSHNELEQFTADYLPKSLEYVDLSYNRITYLQDVSKLLPHLKEINLNDNKISCECDFIKYRDLLLQNDVHIDRPANCYTPESVRGISMLSVYCVSGKPTYDDLEYMLRDEPGSGEDVGTFAAVAASSDILDFDNSENNDSSTYDKIEDDYFPTNADSSSSSPESDEDSLEGSGSSLFDARGFGSGEGDVLVTPDPNYSHCRYNCSTPAPDYDVNPSAPPANISDELVRIFHTFMGQEDSTTTTTTTTTLVPVQEEEIQQQSIEKTFAKGLPKEIPPTVTQEDPNKTRAGVSSPNEVQNVDTKKGGNSTTYIVVGVLFAAMVALIVYVVLKKKRSRRNNNRRPVSSHNDVKEPHAPVELKPLMTENIPEKTNSIPVEKEKTPLINGQNGTSMKPETEEPAKEDTTTTDGKPPIVNGLDVPEEEEFEVRPKKEEDALVPASTKRVTIQAKELSSPKSPVLVHRYKSDDGTIYTTPPVSNNEIKSM